MRTGTRILFIGLVWPIMLPGCLIHTYVGGRSDSPPVLSSTEEGFRLTVEIHGKGGRAYSDRTQKTIYLAIRKKGGGILLSREYRVEAAGLSFDADWTDSGKVTVVFFDFPEGFTKYSRPRPPARQVFSLRFEYDTVQNTFAEAAFQPPLRE